MRCSRALPGYRRQPECPTLRGSVLLVPTAAVPTTAAANNLAKSSAERRTAIGDNAFMYSPLIILVREKRVIDQIAQAIYRQHMHFLNASTTMRRNADFHVLWP